MPKTQIQEKCCFSLRRLHQKSKSFKEFRLRFLQAANLEYLVLYGDLKQMSEIPNSKKSVFYLDFYRPFIGPDDLPAPILSTKGQFKRIEGL